MRYSIIIIHGDGMLSIKETQYILLQRINFFAKRWNIESPVDLVKQFRKDPEGIAREVTYNASPGDYRGFFLYDVKGELLILEGYLNNPDKELNEAIAGL